MITVTSAQLAAWLGQLFWPFVRVGACLMVAPAFGAASVPARIRIVLAGAIALTIAPLVSAPVGIEPLSARGVVVTVQQIVIGVALGFSLQLIFDAVTLGGQMLANGMGLSFAYNIDPLHGEETTVVGQLYGMLVLLVFLALNGHLLVIRVLVDGFRTLPVGTASFGAHGLWQLATWGSEIFRGALAISLPGVTALAVVNLAFGVMSRAAPALNPFSVGFPISLLLGLLIVLVSLPMLETTFVRLMSEAFRLVQHLLGPSV
ncbi:MAG: flagellar biosynthetic protein FliR [Steroidobacteraceae bacterium]